MDDLDSIRHLCRNCQIKWTLHALKRIRQRKIKSKEVIHAILNGEIIQKRQNDRTYPSYLIFNSDCLYPLHIVVGMDIDLLYIITAYIPTLNDWEDDYKTRRR